MIIDVSLNQTSGSGGVTININSLGTKSLLKYLTAGTTTNLAANDLILNKDYLFRYSFSAGAFIWINPTSGDQTNIAGTSGNFIKINTDNTPIDSGQSQSNFSANGIFAFSGDNLASPNTTTGAQNDVVITGLNVFGWNGAGASSINGFGGGTQGRILYVLNESSTYQLTLNNENTGSASTNRLRTPDQGANIIGPRQSVQLIYDSTDSRWLVQDEGTYRSNPAMNGSVSAGTAGQLPSAGDHVHPSDTTRAIGPGSSTAGDIVGFSGTDGETLKDLGTPLSVLNSAVTPGTTGNVLTSNGSAWTSAAPSGGGGTYPFMSNGKIAVSVASNNITLALKTLAGADPSAGSPVTIVLNGVSYSVTAALSVTKNAGTNWFNAGEAELATQAIDYFAYLGYNATDGVVIGFARIPSAKDYADFSVTTNNGKYCAISTITHAAATDPYAVIGRFEATNSGSSSYNWSVPTYTPKNLIQRPIWNARETWLTAALNPINITIGNGTVSRKYQVTESEIIESITFTMGSTSSMGSAPNWNTIFQSTIGGFGTNSPVLGYGYVLKYTVASYPSQPLGQGVSSLILYPEVFNVSGSNIVHSFLSSTIPFTWAANDQFEYVYRYPY